MARGVAAGRARRNASLVMAVCLLSAGLLGVPVGAEEGADAPEAGRAALTETFDGADEYVEEVIVTAERLKKGAIPTQTVIVQTYNVLTCGKRLYNARRYQEALPYLLVAAKRGFKWAQAMVGDIYLHGRGGVPRDIESGMGWLGVAARAHTAPTIQSYFRQAMAEMPASAVGRIDEVVAHYREQWSSRDWRVSCRRTVTGSRMGMGVASLRLNKRLSCTFADEVPVCREPLWNVEDVLDPEKPLPFRWVCPPVTG